MESVNTGGSRPILAKAGTSGIDKRPVPGPVRVDVPAPAASGLAGDTICDADHHGGPDQAVYAYAREDLEFFAPELGPLRAGMFGENLTTVGIDVNEAEIGERWQVGEVLLEVRSVRTPCNDFKVWMGRTGYDSTAWVRRFAQVARPGPYLRVLGEGVLRAGDDLTVVHRPGHGVTVSTMFRALNTDHSLLPRLLDVPDLLPKAREKAETYLAAR